MENVVAQELDAHGFKLHYFNAKRYGEVDFVVQDRRDVIPIEVKSGNDRTSHPALDKLLKVSEWDLGHVGRPRRACGTSSRVCTFTSTTARTR